jgi:hypothetical protein
MDFYDAFTRPDRRTGRATANARAGRLRRDRQHARHFGDFACRHCHAEVSADAARSGVNHRNHCPYCLWSRHVDLHESGDRLNACKGLMQPVGLTFKQVRKKYASGQPGELMLVHQCTACGALSINRVAADDAVPLLWEVFEASLGFSPETRAAALAEGFAFAMEEERGTVQARLFGEGAQVPVMTF